MDNFDRVGGGIRTGSRWLRGCHPQELYFAKCPHLCAPILQAIWPNVRKWLLRWAKRYKTKVCFHAWKHLKHKGCKHVYKLKYAINAINKAWQSKSKSQQTVRRKATTKEGARSSRSQTMKKPWVIPADLRRTTSTTTLVDSKTPMSSNNRQTTLLKREK